MPRLFCGAGALRFYGVHDTMCGEAAFGGETRPGNGGDFMGEVIALLVLVLLILVELHNKK